MFDLYVSSFGPFRDGNIFKVNNISDQIQAESTEVSNSLAGLKWPNEIAEVPNEVFGRHTYTVADGFLVPGKGTGSITVFNTDNDVSFKITKDKGGFFYHRVIWHDMNGDGLLDAITARAKKPMIGRASGELLWLEQPVNNKAGVWKEHIMVNGPDVHFRIKDLNGDGQIEIVATNFFHKKLWLVTKSDGEWTKHLIDGNMGKPFDIELHDLNNDGKLDLLATNHENDDKAAVFGYEIPADLTSEWKRHTLYSGFKTLQKGVGQGSPGEALAIHPNKNDTSSKPVILVAGDGSQKAHMLTPVSQDSNSWEYTEEVVVDVGCTVGKLAIEDVDFDGYMEIFVPAYDKDKIHVLEFTK